MTRSMANAPPMTPPTIAPTAESLSERSCGPALSPVPALSPDKRQHNIITLLLQTVECFMELALQRN